MHSRLFAVLFCLLLVSPLLSQVGKMKPSASNSNFDQLAAQFMYDSLVLSPLNASQAGYHKHSDPTMWACMTGSRCVRITGRRPETRSPTQSFTIAR